MDEKRANPRRLGDIEDIEAFVRAIAGELTSDWEEREELVADGLEFVSRRYRELAPGESLREALGRKLKWHMLDRRRERHPEWRRNTRTGESYSLAPTGLAWEHEGEARGLPVGRDTAEVALSRLNLAIFAGESDLRDSRKTGAYVGVPSHRALATGQAGEIWAAIREERGAPVPSTGPAFSTLRSL
jgi:hypothetical protein